MHSNKVMPNINPDNVCVISNWHCFLPEKRRITFGLTDCDKWYLTISTKVYNLNNHSRNYDLLKCKPLFHNPNTVYKRAWVHKCFFKYGYEDHNTAHKLYWDVSYTPAFFLPKTTCKVKLKFLAVREFDSGRNWGKQCFSREMKWFKPWS